MAPLLPPLNFAKWLSENAHLLQPPVNNFCLYNSADFTVMAVGGPNARTDYHINETEEWFFQHRGAMLLKVVDDGEFKEVHIGEGDMFMLPGGVPHNPVRFADTIGIVIERKRPAESLDRLRWYCEKCQEIVHEDSFHCVDLGKQLKPVIEAYYESQEKRTCAKCGHLNPKK
ncbi:3-hydroxyanthranilic acid dioxygenase [Geranomyces michiganensis]|nr:3-hydroxyanthranilic acid dioxygenase [Geranomyces michiganensis]